MTGHIKLDRKILSWEWYSDANTFRVFVHLLLMATHKDGRYRGREIKRGEVVTGRLKLATVLRLSENEIRRSLFHLKSTNEITTRVTNRFSIITICKYDFYQSIKNMNDQQNDQQNYQQLTNNAPTVNQQLTTFKNVNNVISNNINNTGFAPDAFLPLASEFNGLPEVHAMNYINLIRVTKHVEVSKVQVETLWEIFKTEHLTGETEYKDEKEVYRHFINSNKNHSFKKENSGSKKKKGSDKEIKGLNFINDFTECEMSDGSIQKLELNQIELARYNQISPNSITKK